MSLKPCPIATLLDSMETCHLCKGKLHLEDNEPTHCENCSWDCEEHEGSACEPLYALHGNARSELKALHARIADLEAQVAEHGVRELTPPKPISTGGSL